ncbi:MAG: glucose-6-phosphate isomerase, partial [Brachybacterium sp.]|nr:glucose-6-phosphate isomerase [Brachybacterium sp.]
MTAPTSSAAPIDPTATDAWAELEAHNLEIEGSLREWFAADPQRAERFTHDAADLHVDLSKNLVSPRTVELLLQLAREVGVQEHRDAMFSGAHINTTEDRSVLHTALRR